MTSKNRLLSFISHFALAFALVASLFVLTSTKATLAATYDYTAYTNLPVSITSSQIQDVPYAGNPYGSGIAPIKIVSSENLDWLRYDIDYYGEHLVNGFTVYDYAYIRFSGTPTSAGTGTLSIQITDGTGNVGTGAYVFEVLNSATLTFDSNGGSSVDPISVIPGSTPTRPADPTFEGMTFVNWFSDAALTQVYNFSSPLSQDTTVYAKWTGTGSVTVHYVDQDNKSLHEDTQLSGEIGSPYQVQRTDISGYTLTEVKGNESGSYTLAPQSVTYVYTKNSIPPVGKGQVIVSYLDENNTSLRDTIQLTGDIGSAYSSEQLAFEGYTFKEVLGQPAGVFSNETQTVTYIYTKDSLSPVQQGQVVINYVDENNTHLADAKTLSGTVGSTYSTDALSIDGYTLQETIGNPSGTFTQDP